MLSGSRLAGAGLAALLAAGIMTEVREASAEPVSAAPAASDSLTLVTGDRVRYRRAGAEVRVLDVAAGEGRAGILFTRQQEDGDTYVVPADAAPRLASGRLDRRLFNVSELVRSGYAGRDLPLIVKGATRSARTGAGAARVVRELPAVSASAVQVPRTGAVTFWSTVSGRGAALSGGVDRIWLDGRVKTALDVGAPRIGAPDAWRAGHTGRGVTVAVLDTGVDTDHPDLAGAVTAARDFTAGESGVDDRFGHGTHVAGIITGGGDRYRGLAPDVALLNGKVLDDEGYGNESWIIAGMQWAVEQGADVVNMSLGGEPGSDGADPMSVALDELSRQSDTLFVVAAGNSGPGKAGLTSPGGATSALTVGAVDRNDALAASSGRGPRLRDQAIKPDLTAPGVGIVAARAGGSGLGTPVDEHYTALSGTSMATPRVAGAAALLAGRHPDWTGERLKAALMGTATPGAGGTVYEQGAGRVDVTRATSQPVSATPPSLSLGTALWPHADDEPSTDELMYHNDGDAPVTLDLATDVRDPAGAAAPAGMFAVEPARLVVPARGTAVARLVTDTRIEAPDGTYGGLVTATAPGVSVRTPVGVTRERRATTPR